MSPGGVIEWKWMKAFGLDAEHNARRIYRTRANRPAPHLRKIAY